jgi:UDP-N-acetylglucosamine/UDP-N-acetylgalactosamine diphosphorylase
MLAALESSGQLADIRRRGLRQLFYFQVDNPLVGVCDPEFIGYHLLAGSEMSTQVVAKQTPRDNVGNVVEIDGRVQILEYSDLNPLPDEIVLRREADGSPVFWAGNIAVHVMDVAFLQRMAANSDSLPFHVARKKVPFIDETGQLVEPEQPNAMKFERFIFDLLPAAERSIVMEVDEAAVFAPLKNAPGAERDSPERVQAQMMALHRRWLRAAGAEVGEDVPVEISPLWALDAEELRAKVVASQRFNSATYLDA